MRRRMLMIVTLALIAGCGGLAVASESGPPVTADPRVREVTTMVRGGLSTDLILAKVEDLGAFPELSAEDLVALKALGVPEPVLVRMVELRAPAPSAPVPAAPAPAAAPAAAARPPDTPAPAEAPAALLRVEVERGFPITYYEVAVDGEVVARAGRLWQGESRPGEKLQRPSRLRADERFSAVEIEVEPGEHEVAVGFAVTAVVDDGDNLADIWASVAVERYLNRGVRALAEPGDPVPGDWGAASSTRCAATAATPCTVVANLERRAPTPLGGLPEYSVSYR